MEKEKIDKEKNVEPGPMTVPNKDFDKKTIAEQKTKSCSKITEDNVSTDITGTGHSGIESKIESKFSQSIVLPNGYNVEKQIASGGQGSAWLVNNTHMGRKEVVKVLHNMGDKARERFRREITTTAGLDHTNIVTIYYADPEQGYFAMEYLEGGTLEEYLKEEHSLEDKTKIFIRAARGLHLAHTKGVIHRDLKPQNILLSSTGIPKIVDFGLAKVIEVSDGLTSDGQVIGTLNYMAPEQFGGVELGYECDIWALGVILYKIVTGKTPFYRDGNSAPCAIMNAILNTPPFPPPEDLCLLGKKLVPIYERALEKEQQKRYKSVKEMLSAIVEVLKNKHVLKKEEEHHKKEKQKHRKNTKGLAGAISKALGKRYQLNWSNGLWKICWNGSYIDFTNDMWLKLPVEKQILYAKEYQQWYAKYIGQPVEKTFNVKQAKFAMRFIPPGCFFMGSPKNELERQSNELLHKVILTKGFWLADTVCTQELWEVVMGDNPSRFRGKKRPVEKVSWNDCKAFLKKINGICGFGLRLPTEAEWEYACRAGTNTPFSFGNNITTDQVNYNGNHPYRGGHKEEYREQTVEVKSLPCNNWGLYEIHGNVWECCNDWYGESTAADTATNPTGFAGGVYRVIRGGNWSFLAWYARSAYRGRGLPITRDHYQGFRFAQDVEFNVGEAAKKNLKK